MYLKKLEISGFKSFANSTVLEFNPPERGHFSVTAIVGPNGSGKSNIADAVRWVLGEQSVKQLRGKKSDDVIFGGSAGRGHLSAASVSMVLDNRDGRADIEYEELVITRRIYRSGESEYLINGNQVRLIDLQLLLAQAQFGHGSYGVIGQGMIDRLLIQTAAERKSFFDEAVGIKEFQIKRHQAYLKLCRTKEHITQAQTVIAEIEPHLKTLKRQAKKLTERQEVESSLIRFLTDYYASMHRDLTSAIEASRASLNKWESLYQKQERELNAIQVELAELAKSPSRQEQFNVLEREYQELTKQKAETERRASGLAGRIRAEYAKVGKQNIGWLEEKIMTLGNRLKEISRDSETWERELSSAREIRSRFESELSTITRERAEIIAAVGRLERQWSEARASDHEISFSGMRSAEEIIRVRNEFSGVVHGLVAHLGSVEEKFRLALEVAAGSHLSSIVVEHDRLAEECIRFLKDRQLGVATFLPLNKIKPRPVPSDIEHYKDMSGVYGLAVELVRFNSELSSIFSFVFGATLIVESIETARSVGIGRVRMVTLAGDVLEISGLMKGGYRRTNASALHFSGGRTLPGIVSVDALERHLETERGRLTKIDAAERAMQDSIREAQLKEHTIAEKVRIATETSNSLSAELSDLETERSLATMSKDEYTAFAAELASERDTIGAETLELDKKIQSVRERLSDLGAEEETKRQRVFALQNNMQEAQARLNETVAAKNAERMETVKLETRCEDMINDGYAELKQPPALWEKNCVERYGAEQFDDVKNEIEKLKYRLSLIGGIDGEVLKEYEETQSRYDYLSGQLSDLTKASADIETLIIELDSVMKKKHSAAFAKIRSEFSRYFAILFDGGKADLIEVYGEPESENAEESADSAMAGNNIDPEEVQTKKRAPQILTGIDVVAVPPGKKIKNIAALSGGERTLTSIALVSAILHTNPPPFVFLDEVEAALDEANTVRFNTILGELSARSQFVLITHNRATMHAADILYGVTMGDDGVSKLLSVTLGS